MSAQDLISSIDPCSGQASLTIPLLGQVGFGALDLSLTAAYRGGTLAVATGWNQDAPTGILGLGWNIGLDRIVARYAQSTLAGDASYVLHLRGAQSPLICTGVGVNGVSTWAAAQYRFWQISFDPHRDLWTVIDEDGLTYSFGDAASGRGTVDWGVAWGGWAAASGVAHGQRAIALGWSLAEVSDLFGAHSTYSYTQVSAPVAGAGGLSYTQASYLSSIIGADGSALTLSYAAKTAAEYQDPHAAPVPPNGWQDRFETQFLTGATIAGPAGGLVASVVLGYATDLGGGGLTKRVLTSITRLSAAGEQAEPPTLFSYYGENGGDGVSATTIFAGSALYGAMKAMTLPTGGTVTYAYQSALLSYAGRSLPVAPQAGWTSPVVYAGDDQVLVTWLAASTVQVVSYVWDGRWIATPVMQVPLGSAAYGALQVAASDGYCAARIGATLMTAARDPTRPGAWFPAASFTLTPSIGAAEAATLACGKGFAALLGATAGNLLTFRFTGTGIGTIATASGWVADAAITIGAQGAGLALSAKGAVLTALTVPASGAATLWFAQLAASGAWNAPITTTLPAGLASSNLTLQCGQGFAIASSFTAAPGGFVGACVACWWDAAGVRVSSQAWPATFAVSATVPAVAGSTVVVGQSAHRFTGTGWNSFSLGSITYPNTTGDPVLSVGADVIARRFTTGTGGGVADLLVYDPVGGSWSVPAGLSVTGAGTAPLAAVAAQTRSDVASYAVVGAKLWFRAATGGWTSALNLPGAMTAADMATIRLIGDSYLAFQTGTGTAGVATAAYLLKNGAVTAAPSQPPAGQQIALPAATAGTTVAQSGFVTFTGTFGTAASQMALYRPVFGGASGTQTGYTVASVTSDNGYAAEPGVNGQVATAFAYQNGTIDHTGTVPRFNTVTATPGQSSPTTPANGTSVMAYYTGLTAAETPATPYPTAAGNAATYTQAMLGTLYQSGATATAAGAQTLVSQTTLCHQVTLLPLGTAGVGAYHRPVQLARMQDGVTGVDSFTYDATSGFPRSRSTQVTNATGGLDSFSEQLTYFYEEYDANRTLNLLSPVVQRVRQSQPAGAGAAATVGIDVVAWRDWSGGAGQWAPEREYRGLGAGVTFTAWASGQTPPAADFVLVSQVNARTATGAPIETVDALGARSSVAYDQTALHPVATAVNCPAGQMVWYGCEPYESTGPWVVNAPGRSITDYLTSADYHTGSRSIALPANAPQTGPLLAMVPADQTRRYLFSCWARTAATFAPASGVAQWTVTLYNPATLATVGAAIPLVLTPTGAATPSAVGQWAYFQVTIDLPSLVAASRLAALGVAIQATNANTGQICFVDELRFMPLDCGFAGQVYTAPSFRQAAAIDANGQSIQDFYDNRDRRYLSIGPDGRVLDLQIATYSRWATGTNNFTPAFPNVTLSLGSSVGSVYYDFHNGGSADWTFGVPASWSIAGGVLAYSGATSDTAVCALLAAPNQAARVTVTKSATASASVALGNGKYLMRWTNPAGSGSGAWTLEDAAQGQPLYTNSVAGFDPEWLFAVIDGVIVGYAGSTQLFAYSPSTPPSLTAQGRITLTATAPTTFDDLTILQDPSFTLTANNGLGDPFSRLSLLGYQPAGGNVLFPGKWVLSASHLFYDPLGQAYAAGQPLEAPLQIAPPAVGSGYSLISADQGTYLYDSSGTQIAVPAYLAGTTGRTFSEATYEASPLARIADFDAPRAAFAAGVYYCTQQTLHGSSTTVGAAPTAGAGPYGVRLRQALRQNSATPSPGATAVTVLDQTTTDGLGRLLMSQSGPAGGTLLKTGYGYNAAGLLATINHPNYYAPPAGTAAANWQESLSYDFLGRLVSRTAPDSGTRQWAYDSLGRARFLYLAGGAPVGSGAPATILYMKYDALGRAVETGYIRDSRYAWGAAALTAMLDVAAFPIIATTPTGPNQAAGAVGEAYSFDTDGAFTNGASFTRFLVGRVAATTITPSDGAAGLDVESYGYDALGNVVAKTVIMPGVSPAAGWTTRTAYNLNNQPLSITYPNMLATATNPTPAGTPVTVGYGYDRLGRLAAVGGQATGAIIDPAHPPTALDMSYAGYAYDTFGRPVTAQYNNGGSSFGASITSSFVYDDNQRLIATSSPYFAEGLSYDAGATLSGWSYFNAAVAQATTGYPAGIATPQPPSAFSQQFTYDGYGRLATAASSLGAGYSLTMGAGGAAYDANGNILGKTIGASAIQYAYAPPVGGAPSNRVTSLATTASAAVDFTQAAPALNGWAYMSSNGGPSSSGLTTSTPVSGGAQALKLAGGSESHYEVLRLATYLTPGVTYTLAWSAATDASYPTTPGGAVDGAEWFAVLDGANGPFAALPLATLAASGAWTAGTATIDLTPATIAQIAGNPGDICGVSIELRNRCLGANGAPGAAVYVKSASVAAVGAPATASSFGYSADGAVISSTGRALGQIAYDTVTGLTAKVTIGVAGSTSSLALAYGASGLRSRATLTPLSGAAAASRTVTITGPDGSLLATQSVSGTNVTADYYLNGAKGPFARLTGAGTLGYFFVDRLGSLRAVIDGLSGARLVTRDFGAFGDAQRGSGTSDIDIGYTGQRLDAATGLYNYNARLHDPLLGRFYATDPAGEYSSPYSYVGNDPVNATDPSGALSKKLYDVIAKEWDDDYGDFLIVDHLFSKKDRKLLNEYYYDALPNIIWKRRYPKGNITSAFGRNDEDRLANFTQSFHPSPVPPEKNNIQFYENYPGQAGGAFGFPENRNLFLQFLRVAMVKSSRIYINLAGLLKEPIVDVAFNNPDAILHFFNFTGGYDPRRLNTTSVAYIAKTLPELSKTLTAPTSWFGLVGGGLNMNGLLYSLYLPGHTAWEVATIVSNSTLRAKATFFNGTLNYSYEQYKALIPPMLGPNEVASEGKQEL